MAATEVEMLRKQGEPGEYSRAFRFAPWDETQLTVEGGELLLSEPSVDRQSRITNQ